MLLTIAYLSLVQQGEKALANILMLFTRSPLQYTLGSKKKKYHEISIKNLWI